MKRSSHVALLLMGVTTAGASAYALLPPRDCVAPEAASPGAISPQTIAPGSAVAARPTIPCASGRRSWISRTYWSRSYSYSYGSSSEHPSGHYSGFSPSRSHTSVPSVGHAGAYGGFGGVGHSMGGHSAGGHSSGG